MKLNANFKQFAKLILTVVRGTKKLQLNPRISNSKSLTLKPSEREICQQPGKHTTLRLTISTSIRSQLSQIPNPTILPRKSFNGSQIYISYIYILERKKQLIMLHGFILVYVSVVYYSSVSCQNFVTINFAFFNNHYVVHYFLQDALLPLVLLCMNTPVC